MRFGLLSTSFGGLALAGCASTSVPVATAPGVAAQNWEGAPSTSRVAPATEFWSAFRSPPLSAMIADALRENASLEAARARIQKARSDVRIAKAALLPTIGANTGITKARSYTYASPNFDYSASSSGIDISYDIDLFGGARAGKRAAAARFGASRYDAVAAALVVETDVARDFVQYSGLCDRIALLDRNLANARDLLRIIGVRRREGVATSVEFGLQSIEVSKLAASRTTLDQSRQQMVVALAVLLGREAPGFALGPASLRDLTVPRLDPGQPGDLVFRRPDVLAAEARIAAARGDVAQARAAFRPSLKLSSSGLVEAATLAGPFGVTLSLAGKLFAPIFSGGRLRGQLDAASSAQLESLALYRQSLLTALGEGSEVLAATHTAGDRVDILAAALGEARRTSVLARHQYLEGAADLGTVLDAQRNEIAIEDSAAVARVDQLSAVIDLYKALGGGPVGLEAVLSGVQP